MTSAALRSRDRALERGSDVTELAAICRARRIVAELGGRFSVELGVDLDLDPTEAERWALAATLLGGDVSTAVAARTFRMLDRAGIRTLEDAGRRSWGELVTLLDEACPAWYDDREASALLELGRVVGDRYGGRVSALARRAAGPAALEAALLDLPGWGPTTVQTFLRELRGVWPSARVPLDARAARGAGHLRLPSRLGPLARLAAAAHLDVRDLEAALVRLGMCHELESCPGGEECAYATFEPAQLTHF